MLLGAGAHVGHRQFQAVLQAVDTLVFRAVVHKGALDVLHAAHQFDICDKDDDTDHALQHRHHRVRRDKPAAQPGDKQGQHHKNPDGHDKGKYHHHRHEHALQLFPKHLVQPCLEFGRGFLLVVLEKAAGPGQGAHAQDHGVRETENTADKGQSQDLCLPGHTHVMILFHLNFPVRFADRDRVIRAVLHHNALDYRLSADS